jgi:hypothetical protein
MLAVGSFMAAGVKAGVLALAAVFVGNIASQDAPKPLDPAKAHTSYSFAIRTGAEPFRFQVQVDKTGGVTGVSIFRAKSSIPFQILPACKVWPEWGLTEYDQQLDLLKHADLNFDGFEDLQLLQYYHPHLGKSGYCIYTWDRRVGRFRYAPEIPALDPVVHRENRTITVHEDFQGVPYRDSTYRWIGGKVELIEEDGRVEGSETDGCHSTDYCSRLIKGEMVITAEQPVQCDGRQDVRLECAVDSAKPAH